MANIITYDLLKCSNLFENISGMNNNAVSPYVDSVVTLNGDDAQSFTVKKNIQARFFAPKSADVTSNVQYSVTSIVFNGIQALSAPANLTVEDADNIHIQFPLFGFDPNGYTSNLANAVHNTTYPTASGYFERNFPDFMQGLLDSLGINAQITNSHPEWWVPDSFEIMENFMLEMYSSDSLVITMTETYNGVSRELMYEVNGTEAKSYLNGVDVTLIPLPANELPQYGDAYSIESVALTIDSLVEVDCCPVIPNFRASFSEDSCCSTVSTDCDCTKICFTDTSSYVNGMPGHESSLFNHRTLVLTRPDGSEYVWSTDGVVNQQVTPVCGCNGITFETQAVDIIIEPQWNSSNIFCYNFTDSDSDGIYSIEMFTYPDWDDSTFYNASFKNIVYRSGVIYKQVQSSTNIDPELDTENLYWSVLTDEDDKGRYSEKKTTLVTCISIMECYRKAVEAAVCIIGANPCKSMCDNKDLLKAMKMRVVLDALEYAQCAENWILVKEHLSILKGICCCNG